MYFYTLRELWYQLVLIPTQSRTKEFLLETAQLQAKIILDKYVDLTDSEKESLYNELIDINLDQFIL